MFYINSAIVFLLFIMAVDCQSIEQKKGRIYGGRFAEKGEFPFMVGLSYRPNSVSCGGTLLSEWHVLTACHCVTDVKNKETNPSVSIRDSGNARIIAGTLSRNVPEEQGYQVRNVHYWICHPKYRIVPALMSDTAMIKLTQRFVLNFLVLPIEFPRNVTIWRDTINRMSMESASCTTMGWGLTVTVFPSYKEKGHPARYLKALDVNLTYTRTCFSYLCRYSWPCIRRMYEMFRNGSQERICADTVFTRNGTVCSGDSGSPLVCDGVLTGVVSYGPRCNFLYIPNVYARVDTAHDFIFEQLGYSSCDHQTSKIHLGPAFPFWTVLLLMVVCGGCDWLEAR